MKTKDEYADIFKKNLVGLLTEAENLIKFVNSHRDVINKLVPGTGLSLTLLQFTISAAMSSNPEILVHGFIKRSCGYWDQIASQNLIFLTQNANTIFSEAPEKEVAEFSRAFELTDANGVKILTDEKILTLWGIFRAMVISSVKYIHMRREPGDGKYNNPTYFQEISLNYYIKLFNIKMD